MSAIDNVTVARTFHEAWAKRDPNKGLLLPVDKPNTFLGKINRDDFLNSWPNLYNLATDPGENYDLASRYPEKCDAMEEIMCDWNREIETNPGGWL